MVTRNTNHGRHDRKWGLRMRWKIFLKKLIQKIVEEIIEEKAIDENPHEGFLVLYEYYSNYSNSDTGE